MEEQYVTCPFCSQRVALRHLTPPQRIQALAHERGLSQRALAAQVGVHETQLSRIVHGARVFPAELVVRLAEALGVTCEELAQEQEVSG